ncbi:hypothetical protein ACJMK2_025978, partial [Sinanodonta woodiana]
KMILNILRKALKKTRKTYMQAYRQTENRKRMYKDALIRLESKMRFKKVIKQALRVKAKEDADRFVKALELEQTAKVKMITRNADVGVDAKQILGFEPKVQSMTQKVHDRESYL